MNSHLMASCVSNICTNNYQNLITDFQVIVENVGDVFWDTVYMYVNYENVSLSVGFSKFVNTAIL